MTKLQFKSCDTSLVPSGNKYIALGDSVKIAKIVQDKLALEKEQKSSKKRESRLLVEILEQLQILNSTILETNRSLGKIYENILKINASIKEEM